jgi:hypothetical protein
MNQQYDNELKFRLFKNDKGGNEKRPDYRGEVRINGVDYKLSGWLAEAKNGSGKYIRGVVERKDGVPARPSQPAVGKTVTIPGIGREETEDKIDF